MPDTPIGQPSYDFGIIPAVARIRELMPHAGKLDEVDKLLDHIEQITRARVKAARSEAAPLQMVVEVPAGQAESIFEDAAAHLNYERM